MIFFFNGDLQIHAGKSIPGLVSLKNSLSVAIIIIAFFCRVCVNCGIIVIVLGFIIIVVYESSSNCFDFVKSWPPFIKNGG
jgi:hypothetical protein